LFISPRILGVLRFAHSGVFVLHAVLISYPAAVTLTLFSQKRRLLEAVDGGSSDHPYQIHSPLRPLAGREAVKVVN
jgi:hypothetical protein